MSSAIKSKDQLIQEIRERISDIPGVDAGRPVNLDNVLFNESGRSGCGGKISVTCLFINDDGNVCADMYRAGTAGCIDFICGLTLNSADEKALKKIISALEEKRWSVPDYPLEKKQKKRNSVTSFRIPFLQKGA
jgi:hypothetical protein